MRVERIENIDNKGTCADKRAPMAQHFEEIWPAAVFARKYRSIDNIAAALLIIFCAHLIESVVTRII